MIKFRGTTPEGKVVEGYYEYDRISKEYSIFYQERNPDHPGGWIWREYIVPPSSLAMSTGISDKKRTKKFPEGEEIYGSFEYEPGKFSEGGDNVKRIMGIQVIRIHVQWTQYPSCSGWSIGYSDVLEVIPKEKE